MKPLALILLLAGICHAAPRVKLAWDANPEPDVSYRISYRVNGGGETKTVDAGKLTEIPLPEVTPGVEYRYEVAAIRPDGVTSEPSEPITYTLPRPSPNGWTVKSVDSEEINGYASELAIDGDPATFWHTKWRVESENTPMPHEIVIDLGAAKTIEGVSYLPRQDGESFADIKGYQFHTSLDGTTWGDPAVSGEFPPGKQLTTVAFPPRLARYCRLTATSAHNGQSGAAIAEISFLITPGNPPVASPKKLRVVRIETSSNLKDWEPLAFVPLQSESSARFIRAGISEITTP